MTPEQIEMHRQRFEELIRKKMRFDIPLGRYQSGSYRNSFVDGSWQGYLLCAENMEVELPAALTPGGEITESDVLCRMAHNDLLAEVKFTLESQGIKVKP